MCYFLDILRISGALKNPGRTNIDILVKYFNKYVKVKGSNIEHMLCNEKKTNEYNVLSRCIKHNKLVIHSNFISFHKNFIEWELG